MKTIDLSMILMIIGALTIITNLITEVLKKLLWNKIPTNILVVVIAMSLTFVALAAYARITGFVLLWYHIAAAVVLGLLVAYAAMFGFDKLKQALEQIGGGYGNNK